MTKLHDCGVEGVTMLERAAELAGAEAAPRASPAIYTSCPEVTVAVIAVHITLERGRVTSCTCREDL